MREPVVQREPQGSSSNEITSSPCACEREKAPIVSPKIWQPHALIGPALSLPLSTSRASRARPLATLPLPRAWRLWARREDEGRRHEEAGTRERMSFYAAEAKPPRSHRPRAIGREPRYVLGVGSQTLHQLSEAKTECEIGIDARRNGSRPTAASEGAAHFLTGRGLIRVWQRCEINACLR